MSALPGFQADWWDFLFLHYAVEADRIAGLTPFPLDRRDGHAFMSLVFFRLERMRLGRPVPAWIGEKLCAPISDHFFLNFRVYVRGPAGPGIQFIAEWVNNPLSRLIGPVTYGLPYRRADFWREMDAGRRKFRFAVRDHETGGEAVAVAETEPGEARRAQAGLEAFLLERYTAYTVRRGREHLFRVEHRPWMVRPAAARLDDRGFFHRTWPWFADAKFCGAHAAPGFPDVTMSALQRIPSGAPSISNGYPPAPNWS